MRVLTYNVCYAGVEQDGKPWEDRRDAVASTIRAYEPSVVCLQETWQGQVADLQERLPGYEWVGQDHGVGWHTPIAYDPAHLTLHDWETFWLAPDPDQRAAAWDASFPRVVTRATFETFDCYSVHLDHEGEQARLEGTQQLVERVRDRGRPAVLGGDLNCQPGAPPYERLTAELTDAAEAGSVGPDATFNDFGPPAELCTGRRLDYLLTRGVDITEYGVCTNLDATCAFPSDHCPVRATIELPSAESSPNTR